MVATRYDIDGAVFRQVDEAVFPRDSSRPESGEVALEGLGLPVPLNGFRLHSSIKPLISVTTALSSACDERYSSQALSVHETAVDLASGLFCDTLFFIADQFPRTGLACSKLGD